jgi:predicted RNase H-like HicB family nuclease
MNEPIKYREYTIKNLQLTTEKKWWYSHCEFTGADDKRYGQASTLEEAKSDIDNITIEEQEHTIEVLKRKVIKLKDALLIAQQTVLAYEVRYPGTKQLLNGYSNEEVNQKIKDAL